jgi:hypothetical protein
LELHPEYLEFTMNYVRRNKITVLSILFVLCLGCESRQESPGTKTGAPPENAGGVKVIAGQNAPGASVASASDKADAEAAAVHVLAQIAAGDFPAIYNEAEPGFKKLGSEAQFVAKFQQARQVVGTLNKPLQTSFVSLPDKRNVLVYHLENEHFKTDMRLTFVRSQGGKMELAGLNQHDEPKK